MAGNPLATETVTVDAELKAGAINEIESQIHDVVRQVEQIIDLHDRYIGKSLARGPLHNARHSLKEGLHWFEWSRKNKNG